jgi:hypothetical protein
VIFFVFHASALSLLHFSKSLVVFLGQQLDMINKLKTGMIIIAVSASFAAFSVSSAEPLDKERKEYLKDNIKSEKDYYQKETEAEREYFKEKGEFERERQKNREEIQHEERKYLDERKREENKYRNEMIKEKKESGKR